MTNKLLSIVTPFYNEEETINRYFEILEKTLKNISDINYEIIVVDDGSRDNTYTMLKKKLIFSFFFQC